LTALRALGTAFAQAVLSCVLIASLFAMPAGARSDDEARTDETATSAPAPSASPSEAGTGAGAQDAGQDASSGDDSRGLARGVASGLANSALDSLFETIGEAAVWAFGKVLGWVDATSSPDVTQPWFSEVYGRTYWLSATIALVALVWALTTGALRNGVTGMLGVLPRVLFVVLGLAVAVPIVQTLLEFTDWLSLRVSGEVTQNMEQMATALGAVLVGGAGAAGLAARSSGVPGFVLAVVALIIVIGSLLVWLQLIFRTAVIYLLLAAAAFPAALSINRASARPIRRIAAWITAMAFAKPVIVLALWIGSAPFASGSQADVAAVLTGAGVMITAVFAPWALFRLFDFAGDQVTSAISSSANPSQLRTHVEQPVTTYRRTATAVQEHARTARERGVAGFSPTRSRAAKTGSVAARSTLTTAAGAATAIGAGARAIASRAGRTASATEPRDTKPPATPASDASRPSPGTHVPRSATAERDPAQQRSQPVLGPPSPSGSSPAPRRPERSPPPAPPPPRPPRSFQSDPDRSTGS
jgi:hypothetical protein